MKRSTLLLAAVVALAAVSVADAQCGRSRRCCNSGCNTGCYTSCYSGCGSFQNCGYTQPCGGCGMACAQPCNTCYQPCGFNSCNTCNTGCRTGCRTSCCNSGCGWNNCCTMNNCGGCGYAQPCGTWSNCGGCSTVMAQPCCGTTVVMGTPMVQGTVAQASYVPVDNNVIVTTGSSQPMPGTVTTTTNNNVVPVVMTQGSPCGTPCNQPCGGINVIQAQPCYGQYMVQPCNYGYGYARTYSRGCNGCY